MIDRDRDDERQRFEDLHERLEILRRIPFDDGKMALRDWLRLAFAEGRLCGRDEECECCERLVLAACCCCEEFEENEEECDDDERPRHHRRRRRRREREERDTDRR